MGNGIGNLLAGFARQRVVQLMVKIRLNTAIEFFATRDELAEWASQWIREYHLYGLLVRRWDFAIVKDTEWNDLDEFKALLPKFDELLLGLGPLNVIGKTSNEIASLNPDCLVIQLPRSSPESLEAATLGSVSQERRTRKIWRAIVKDVLDRTSADMWTVNRSIPAKMRYRDLRYSGGAAELNRHGVTLLTFASEIPVFVDEPEL
jgi:hypothetical protein